MAPTTAPPGEIRRPHTPEGGVWIGAWLAFAVPFAVAVASLDGAPRWGDDVNVVRALGLAQLGAEGVVSSALGGLFSVLPLGGRVLRLTLLSAVASGCASWLVYSLLVDSARKRGALTVTWLALAVSAALAASFTGHWRLAALSVGGPLVGMCLLLASLRVPLRFSSSWVVQGVTLGACCVEERALATCIGVSLLVRLAVCQRLLRLRQLGSAVMATAGAVAVLLLPGLLEPISKQSTLHFGLELRLPEAAADAVEGITVLSELGPYFLGLAVLGLVSAFQHRKIREVVGAVTTFVVLGFAADDLGFRLAATTAIACLAAFGADFALAQLQARRLPFADLGMRLLVALHLGAVLLNAERARQSVEHRAHTAAREWSQEAFERLPPRALLLTQTPAIAWRLWAARVTEGTRPDLLLVPPALLSHGNLARDLLGAEPKLEPLIRDVAIHGAASEFSLSQLADERPLLVEPNLQWERRLLAHLRPDGVWLNFSPHPLGRSDRQAGLKSTGRAVRSILRSARTEFGTDFRTLERVGDGLFQQSWAMLALGDDAAAGHLQHRLGRVSPASRHAEQLLSRLDSLRDNPRAQAQLR